jgi:ABC-type transport system substrate-binding protein
MNNKAFVIVVILATFMAFGLVTMAFAANGPKAANLEIEIYNNPDVEYAALQAGTIDIVDWPLTKAWVDSWALMPLTITMDSYVALDMDVMDVNNQAWPTGDPTNQFYTPSSPQANKSVAFRQAVACLTDRDSYVRDILKGYGFRMDTPMPPAQSAYTDMLNYSTYGFTFTDGQSIIYNYNTTRANALLNWAGFTMDTGTGIRIDPMTGNDMKPITFYIRQDDPLRLQAGQMLTTQLRNIGIPVSSIVTERSVCYKNVMILYNYNLYTGGWFLSVIPNQYHDLYSSDTYYGPNVGWATNYPGFCNHAFDDWAAKLQNPATLDDAIFAAKNCGFLFLQYCGDIPIWCSNAVKAYRTGATGVINNAAGGVDNYYTFLNGNVTGDNRWDYGFKSDVEVFNMITAQWLWDANVLGLQYEGLMGVNPFNLVETEYWIANYSAIGTWMNGIKPATYINYTIRPDVHWHNDTVLGRVVTCEDINFSFTFTKACGSAVAWGYQSVATFNRTVIYDALTGYPGSNNITVFYNKMSAWAYLWAGGVPILNPDNWGPLWADTANFPTNVRNYDPRTADTNGDGIKDLLQDGTGAWIFNSYQPLNYIFLTANPYYYLSQDYIAGRLADMFWSGAGDVNKDGIVNTQDLGLMARALFTNSTSYPIGTNWGEYNSNCDFFGYGNVTIDDLAIVTTNYGKTAG